MTARLAGLVVVDGEVVVVEAVVADVVAGVVVAEVVVEGAVVAGGRVEATVEGGAVVGSELSVHAWVTNARAATSQMRTERRVMSSSL